MIVEMEFLFGEDTFVSETDLPAALTEAADAKPAINALFGGLAFGHGESTFKILDEVSWVITTVAFEVVPEVAKSGTATFSYWGADGTLDFKRDGNELEISSEYQGSARFPLQAFLSGTLDAADRFLDLVDAHWPEETVFDRPALRAQAAAARTASAAL